MDVASAIQNETAGLCSMSCYICCICAQAVGHILMDGLVAALGVAVSGLIAMPILASHALRMETAEVLMKVGHSMSG